MRLVKLVLLLVFATTCQARSITADSWLVTDENYQVIAGENIDQIRSIASITKLITAITVIDSGIDLSETIVTKKFGKITRANLIDMAIVKSNNDAARILCETYPGGYDLCIADMNRTLNKLEMKSSIVYDSVGLDNRNKSNGLDLIKLLDAAEHYPEIVSASHKTGIKVKIRKKWIFFNNTNPLIGRRHDIIVSKTGFTNPAGGCLVMLMSTDKGKRAVVVLGSKNTKTRIPEADFIANM